jgi:hypothetical protein
MFRRAVIHAAAALIALASESSPVEPCQIWISVTRLR